MKKHQWLAACCASAMAFSAILPQSVSAATVLTGNATGTEDGYSYELWKDYGNTTMTLLGNGAFSCEWNNIGNALFRTGQKFDCTQSYKDIGNVTVEYDVDYHPEGNSYLCVYGWTKDPLIEYYIVDSWGSWRPPGGDSIGSVTVDGAEYDVYKTLRENKPSIIGDTTFYQYWSVRREKRTSGVISVHEHFKAWESLGLDMSGKFYEIALTVEGYQSNGSATVNKNVLTLGGDAPVTTTAPATQEPDANGYYFYDTFEENMGKWSSRGASSLAYTSDAVCAGEQSLAVTGRTDTWNGAGHDLSASVFQPGSAYGFGTSVMQESGAAQEIRLTLQYNDASGETQYDTVAAATASSGQWVTLENTSYTIPSGASSLLLYVEIADSTCDFYMDEAYGGIEGVGSNAPVIETTTTTTTTTTTAITTTTSESEPITATILGDVNCDGFVKVDDVILLSCFLSENTTIVITEEGRTNADMDGSGSVSSEDATLILRKLAGL